MPSIGPGELILIVIAVLILFGAAKLPEIGRSIGKGIKEFKKGMKDGGDEEDKLKGKNKKGKIKKAKATKGKSTYRGERKKKK